MKNLIAFIAIVLIGNSCQDPTYNGDYYIRNNSNQSITIYFYSLGKLKEPIVLDIDEFSKDSRSERSGIVSPPVFYADSLQVVFNDSISTSHFRADGQDISRNMFYSDSWTGGKIDDYEYQYDYIFTDADYEEALGNEE